MNRSRFDEIFANENYKIAESNGCTALSGLNLIAKYLPKNGICAAEHDIIYSDCDIDELLAAGITEEDVIRLKDMNWMIDSETESLAKFV